jgi:hypothetical protein
MLSATVGPHVMRAGAIKIARRAQKGFLKKSMVRRRQATGDESAGRLAGLALR